MVQPQDTGPIKSLSWLLPASLLNPYTTVPAFPRPQSAMRSTENPSPLRQKGSAVCLQQTLSLPVSRTGRLGEDCVCARQGSILGGHLSSLPSCCLLATLVPIGGEITLALNGVGVGGLWDFSLFPVTVQPHGNCVGSLLYREQAEGKGEPGACALGEVGHSRNCAFLFRE